MRMRLYDIVVVGGGVGGLMTAMTAAKHGLSVALVEMKSEDKIGEKVCGDALGKHHVIELGLDEPRIGAEAEGVFKGVKVVSPDEKHEIAVYGEGYALHRKLFGYSLYRKVVNLGVEAYLGYSFTSPVVEGSWVKGVVVKAPGGGSLELRGRIVVDATGVPAVVRRSLPKEWWVSEEIPKEDFNVTYREVWQADIDIDRDFAWIFLSKEIAPGGYWWLFPKGSTGHYNVGLGVQWTDSAPNPKQQFEKYIRPRFSKRIAEVIHAGGGLVPTRRPIPVMVWNGFMVVGDAAATANPVHGGGIGPAMLSGKIAAEVAVEALSSKGSPSMENLWGYHIRYHRAYGAKQASLDILRMYLQKMSDSDLNYIFESKLVESSELYELGTRGDIPTSIIGRLRTVLMLLTKPTLLSRLATVKRYMDKAKELYLSYPETPQQYPGWREEEKKLFDDFRKWLNTI